MISPTFRQQGEFWIRVATVAGGAVGAQFISSIAIPLIARLYGPEAYGGQGVFLAVMSVVAPFSTLMYPLAIVLPESDEEALRLANVSLKIAALAALIIFFGCIVVSCCSVVLGVDNKYGYLFFGAPFYIFFNAIVFVLTQLSCRDGRFKQIGFASLCKALIENILKIVFGFFIGGAALLIILSNVGILIYALVLNRSLISKSVVAIFSFHTFKAAEIVVLRKYSDFALFRAPQVLLNTASLSVPTLFLAYFYDASVSGLYVFAYSVLNIPGAFLGAAVSNVAYPMMVEYSARGKSLTGLLFKLTAAMAILGLPYFAIIYAYGETLLVGFLGSEWEGIGGYVSMLSAMLYFGFLNKPAVAAIPILKIQDGLLLYEILSTSTKSVGFIVGYFIWNDPLICVLIFATLGGIAYFLLIIWVFMRAVKYGTPGSS